MATFFVSLTSSILSGLASGGGGFIMSPWMLLIGLNPAQMVATGSIGGSSISLGSLFAMRRGGIRASRRVMAIISAMSVASGLLASWLVPHFDSTGFKQITVLLTLIALPLFFSRHARFTAGKRSSRSRQIGYFIMSLLILGSALLFSSVFGLLMALALPFFFGTNTMESTAIRRLTGLIQMIIMTICMHQYILWFFTIATILGGSVGSYIGTHVAARRGETFARRALAATAIISAIALLIK